MHERSEALRLAVVDTDSAFLKVLEKRLEVAGWQHLVLSEHVPTEKLVDMKLDALLVDISILGPDGWSFLESISEAVPGLGVLVCTTDSTVAQRVRGLRLGADDWIRKPCHPDEVIARIAAVARRRKRAAVRIGTWPTLHGEVEVRADQFQAFVNSESVGLTRREFELLQLLAETHGQVIEREEIYQKVWGYAMAHGDRSVDVFVRKLRQKLQRHSPSWTYIHTHFGIGYRFEPEPVGGERESSAVEGEPTGEAEGEVWDAERAPAELASR
jgi:DNA-binding response OmpR family regulator